MSIDPTDAISVKQETDSNGPLWPGVTVGFMAAIAMWLVWSPLHLPGLRVPTPVAGPLLLVVLVAMIAMKSKAAGRRAVAGIDRTAVPSLGTWLRWAHGLRRFAELGLVGLDELTLAGLDERQLPESGGGAVGRMLFGVKEGNGGLGSLLCIGAAEPFTQVR